MSEAIIPIPGRIRNVAVGGHTTGAADIIDDAKNKTQNVINEEVDETLNNTYRKSETYNKTELNNMITTPNQEYVTVTATDQTTSVTDVLPATGAADTVYRVGNWDGSAYDDTVYSEYSWNGTAYVFLRKKDYGIDDEPTAGSNNLAKSGGIQLALYERDAKIANRVKISDTNWLFNPEDAIFNKDIRTDTGNERTTLGAVCTPFIAVDPAKHIKVVAHNRRVYCYASDYTYIGNVNGLDFDELITDAGAEYANTAYIRAWANSIYDLKLSYSDVDNPLGGYVDEKFDSINDSIEKIEGIVHIDTSSIAITQACITSDTPPKWRIDNYRKSKVVPLNASLKYLKIKTKETLNLYYMFVGDYVVPTTSNEKVANPITDRQKIDENTEVILPIPDGAKNFIFNVNNNEGSGIDHTPTLSGYQLEEGAVLNIATYNCGDFHGRNITTPSDEGMLAYRNCIASLDANVLLTQDDVINYGGTTSEDVGTDAITAIYGMYKHKYRYNGTAFNIKGLFSDHFITGITKVNYIVPEGMHSFSHKYFLTGWLYINDVNILFISVHWDWQDIERRREQINQVITYASTYDKVVIAGDTNPSNRINELFPTDEGADVQDWIDLGLPIDRAEIHEYDWAILADAGYSMANDGYFGTFGTLWSSTIQDWRPYDNIFVKGGIIRKAWIHREEYMNDHCPICATVAF